MTRTGRAHRLLKRAWPALVFLVVLLGHAVYVALHAKPDAGPWADAYLLGGNTSGWMVYWQAQDYYVGFSYALGAAFAAWAIGQFVRQRRAAAAMGAAGSVTLVGVLWGAGCFLIGCCGSPMLAVYAAIFGAKAFAVGKPVMAAITLASVGAGYGWMRRRCVACGCATARDAPPQRCQSKTR